MELKDFLDLIRTGGPSAIALLMGALYWLERKDRKECQTACEAYSKAILERALTAINDVKDALEDVRDVVRPRGR